MTEAKTLKEKIKIVNDYLEKNESKGSVGKPSNKGWIGYEPQWVIDAMNEAFEIGEWGFEELEMTLGKTAVVCKIQVWLKDCAFKPTARTSDEMISHNEKFIKSPGDAMKSAQTDALKKALSYFGIGKRAYHGLLKATDQPKQEKAATGAYTKPQSATVAGVSCPKCGQGMKLRNSAKGEFYGCSTYPKCTGTRQVEKKTENPYDEAIPMPDVAPEENQNIPF